MLLPAVLLPYHWRVWRQLFQLALNLDQAESKYATAITTSRSGSCLSTSSNITITITNAFTSVNDATVAEKFKAIANVLLLVRLRGSNSCILFCSYGEKCLSSLKVVVRKQCQPQSSRMRTMKSFSSPQSMLQCNGACSFFTLWKKLE